MEREKNVNIACEYCGDENTLWPRMDATIICDLCLSHQEEEERKMQKKLGRIEIKKMARGVEGNELNVYLIEYELGTASLTTTIPAKSALMALHDFFCSTREF